MIFVFYNIFLLETENVSEKEVIILEEEKDETVDSLNISSPKNANTSKLSKSMKENLEYISEKDKLEVEEYSYEDFKLDFKRNFEAGYLSSSNVSSMPDDFFVSFMCHIFDSEPVNKPTNPGLNVAVGAGKIFNITSSVDLCLALTSGDCFSTINGYIRLMLWFDELSIMVGFNLPLYSVKGSISRSGLTAEVGAAYSNTAYKNIFATGTVSSLSAVTDSSFTQSNKMMSGTLIKIEEELYPKYTRLQLAINFFPFTTIKR